MAGKAPVDNHKEDEIPAALTKKKKSISRIMVEPGILKVYLVPIIFFAGLQLWMSHHDRITIKINDGEVSGNYKR